MSRPFYRSSTNARLAGVCGGLADYLDMDANLVRFIAVVTVILTGIFPGVLIYIAAALFFPKR